MDDDRAAAIEDLYRRRYLAFRNGLLGVTRSVEAARDAVQDAFATALRDRASFRGDGSLEAWVWRIAYRSALRARRPQAERALDEAALEAQPLGGDRDPELAAAIAALAPRRRLVLFLRYFADLSYADIASLCGISEGTVAATLAQARAELAAALEQEGATR